METKATAQVADIQCCAVCTDGSRLVRQRLYHLGVQRRGVNYVKLNFKEGLGTKNDLSGL
jgi:hypothetical protein